MTEIVVATDQEQLLSRISNLVARAADDAISRDDRIFRFGISGDNNKFFRCFVSFLTLFSFTF
jgi:L-aminopeptidase/D-esterase-like protein